MRLSLRLARLMVQHLVLKEVFSTAVNAVQSSSLIRHNVSLVDATLTVVNKSVTLRKPCYIVGCGKAVFGMASELLNVLGDKLERGVLTLPVGSVKRMKMALPDEQIVRFDQKFQVFEGGKDNQADEDALKGAQEIANLCASLGDEDVLLVLISGGGSALLPLPKDGITLEEKTALIKQMFMRGANIREVNCVRRRLSKLKGGGLAHLATPAKVISLILSDVVGDPLDLIASGPTVLLKDKKCSDMMVALQKYKLFDDMSQNMVDIINDSMVPQAASTEYVDVSNLLIGNIAIACYAAEKRAHELGYFASVLSIETDGNVHDIADLYSEIVEYFQHVDTLSHGSTRFQDRLPPKMLIKLERIRHTRDNRPLCLIFGGEPTLVVDNPEGKGGRNMHLALELATLLNDNKGAYFISCGTDGIDGPTDAAGAISPIGMTGADFVMAKSFLKKSDSYNFFKNRKPNFLIKTGHTGTNVMDIHILIILDNK